jgi:hypothetical protein
MNNKLKLFYIFIIIVLLGSIVHLTRKMDDMDVRFIKQNEVANEHMSRSYLYYLEALQNYGIVARKNDELKHDIDSLLEENRGLKHNYIHLELENIALKKALTEK